MRWLSRVTRYFISQQRDVMNNTIFKGRLSLRLTLSRTLYRCPIATPSTPPSILQLSLASAGKCRMELYFFIRRSKLPLPSFLVTGLWFFLHLPHGKFPTASYVHLRSPHRSKRLGAFCFDASLDKTLPQDLWFPV